MNFILPAGKPWHDTMSRLQMHVINLDHSKEWKISVDLNKRKRSESQNSYLWKMYEFILSSGGETLGGWRKEDVHEFMLGEWSGWEITEAFGKKRMRPIKRSSTLSTVEFSEFIAFIQQFCSENMGLYVPDPREGA